MSKENFWAGFAILLFLPLIFFIAFRAAAALSTLPSDDVCEIKYGEDWEYYFYKEFGKTCVKLNYTSFEVSDRKQYPNTNKYCSQAHFFDLSEWYPTCNFTGGEE